MTALRRARFATTLAVGFGLTAAAPSAAPRPVDPLTATIDYTDAQRFADLWRRAGGKPTADQIQSGYLAGAGRGVEIFTPGRIVDAANMARKIAANPALYDQAVRKCLPWVPASTADLRSIYLAIRGLFPDRPLPRIYIVVGGGNSGGTAGEGAQVLGLEVLCREAPTATQFRDLLREFFAHETVHTFQRQPARGETVAEPLLRQMLVEGGADYVASLVTGAVPKPERDAFGRAHEAQIWAQFVKDRPVANRSFTLGKGFSGDGETAFNRWFYSDMGLPPGWKPDMGYWLGMQIAKAYVERSSDPHEAIRRLMALDDPAAILERSGYAEKFTQ